MEKLLKKLAHIVYHYYRGILIAAIFLTCISFFGISKIELITNLAYTFPSENQVISNYQKALEHLGTLDSLVVLIESPETKELTHFSDFFAQGLIDTGLVSDVKHKVTPQEKEFIIKQYISKIFLYLDDHDFDLIKDKLTTTSIDKSLDLNRELLIIQNSPWISKIVVSDPLDFLSIISRKFSLGTVVPKMDISSDYFLSEDNKHLLMLVRPIKPPQDVPFIIELFKKIRTLEEDIKDDYGQGKFKTISVGFSGNHAITYYDSKAIKRDLIVTAMISIVLVLILFYFIFRQVTFLLFVGLSLIFGLLSTFGIVGFTLGHINTVSSVFGAILIGLGIDFSIHFYNRFLEEMESGASLEESIEVATSKTGSGIVMGALTTAIAFFSMVFTQFKGLSEFGILGSIGIIMILISTFTVLPSLIIFYAKGNKKRIVHKPLPTFFMDKFGVFVIEKKGVILTIAIIVTLMMGILATGVGFESDIFKISSKSNQDKVVDTKVQKMFGVTSNEMIITVKGEDLEELLILTEESERIMRSYPEVDRVEGPGVILPSLKKQMLILEKIEELDLEGVETYFKDSLIRHGFNVKGFSSFINMLHSFSHRSISPITYESLQDTPLSDILKRFIYNDGHTWQVYLFAFPNSGVWIQDVELELINKLKELSPNISITGHSLFLAECRKIIKNDFFLAVFLAAIGAFFVLFIQLKEFKGVGLCMFSLCIGFIWMIGFMKILGISFNFANIVVTPMIIGIGIDDNIHLYHRYREKDRGDIKAAISFSGRAIIITTLTSAVGFGSLSFATYEGLRSLGLLAVIGVTCCLLSALFVTPSLLAMSKMGKRKN